jgi:hypothetical protein
MQPYFFPYAGYFRLFAAVDEFLIFDCVQFPRRGRVHRTEIPGAKPDTPSWLTLPLARHSRETRIVDLQFATDARAVFDCRLAAFPWIASSVGPQADRIRSLLQAPLDSPIDYLEAGLRLVLDLLGLTVPLRRTSTLRLDPSLRGQSRVIAAARVVGATEYVNSPGGRALYDAASFSRDGLQLRFLVPYTGPHVHLLPALMSVPAERIRADVMEATVLEETSA